MHPVQDTILTIGSLALAVALIPTVLGKQKPALSTSLLTAATLATFAAVYVSLHLLFSAAVTLFSAAVWLLLAAQKRRQH
ncbi:MAG: hypothetical protein JWO35_863 [Candidatus Saccharibacteria bacterium]|nr:hypothetical protein [Candidatus Saccharibacteria bacterium]